MIVKELLDKKDEDLIAMPKEIGSEPVNWTPVILAELSRRSIVRLREQTRDLQKSSNQLKKLTIVLILLIVILALLAAPPAIEIVQSWLPAAG